MKTTSVFKNRLNEVSGQVTNTTFYADCFVTQIRTHLQTAFLKRHYILGTIFGTLPIAFSKV